MIFLCVVVLQAKLVMRAAAKLAPQEVLTCVGPLQQTCLSLANTGNDAAATAAAGGALVSVIIGAGSRTCCIRSTAQPSSGGVSVCLPGVCAGQRDHNRVHATIS